VDRTITIGKPADELYRCWRQEQNLPRIMGHFAEVTASGEGRTRGTVRGPLGRRLARDARVVEDQSGEILRWESVAGSDLSNEGVLSFRPAPGDRGTEVTLDIRFDPPGGVLGVTAMKILGFAPNTIAERALRRFKSLV
jgi:uncharacterized membrane protein